MKALKLLGFELPTLHNVTVLFVDVYQHVSWQFLPELLTSLPNFRAVFFRTVSFFFYLFNVQFGLQL